MHYFAPDLQSTSASSYQVQWYMFNGHLAFCMLHCAGTRGYTHWRYRKVWKYVGKENRVWAYQHRRGVHVLTKNRVVWLQGEVGREDALKELHVLKLMLFLYLVFTVVSLPTSQFKWEDLESTWILLTEYTEYFQSHLLGIPLNVSHTGLIAFLQTCYTLFYISMLLLVLPSSQNSLLTVSSSASPHPVKITFTLQGLGQRSLPPRHCP